MLDLGDVLELVIDGFDDGAFAEQENVVLVQQTASLVLSYKTLSVLPTTTTKLVKLDQRSFTIYKAGYNWPRKLDYELK